MTVKELWCKTGERIKLYLANGDEFVWLNTESDVVPYKDYKIYAINIGIGKETIPYLLVDVSKN